MTSTCFHLHIRCLLCCASPLEPNNRYLVGGKGLKVDICFVLKSIDVPFETGQDHLCKTCIRKVEKHGKIMANLKKSTDELRTLFFEKEYPLNLKRISIDLDEQSANLVPVVAAKKVCLQQSINEIDNFESSINASSLFFTTELTTLQSTSTPVRTGRPATTKIHESKTATEVKVSVKWPSENYPRVRTLSDNFASLGKALVRGTFSQIANAIFKIKPLKVEVTKCFLRQLSTECADLTSKKNPSILRKSTTEDIRRFELKKVCEELKERAPLYYAVLLTSAVSNRRKDSDTIDFLPSVAVAGSILLRERCMFLNATQVMMAIVLKFSGIQAVYARLCTMKITVSNTTLLRKLDEYGCKFDEDVLDEKAKVSKHLLEMVLLKEKEKNSIEKGEGESLVHESSLPSATISHETSQQTVTSTSNGMNFVMDNFDLRQEVKDMTADNQNKDYHWTNHNCVKNRVSGAHLANDKPICKLSGLPNGAVLPQAKDHLNIRENYIVLVQRIIVEYIPALNFLNNAVQKHIPHAYSKEMAQPTTKTCLGILFEDENTTGGMLSVLKHIHAYLPSANEGNHKTFDNANVIGDQLTVDRAINAIMSQQNGYSEEDRLTHLNIGVADWHTDMNFLQLCFKKLYSTQSGSDQNTLFCDRNKINRRNVKSDVTKAYSQARSMFVLAVKARVLAAALNVFGMKSLNDSPNQHSFPASLVTGSTAAKKIYLRLIAEKVVDKYVIDSKSVNSLIDSVLSEQEQQERRNNQVQNPDGRYPCRVAGCNKSFKYDGKSRIKHEETHIKAPTLSLLVVQSNCQPSKSIAPSQKGDDMFNYQCSLLQHGLLYLNFRDAVAEGDGLRIIRNWKFLLLHFREHSTQSKYALEALHLLLQVYSLLTPRQAHQLMWNRSVNNRGGYGCNVPLDLDLEHDNKYIKEACKKLGKNLTSKAVVRICHSTKVAREVIEKFDAGSKIRQRSGKHVQKSDLKDLGILVDNLVKQDSFTETAGRKYHHFSDFPRSYIKDIDMSSLYKWINDHKTYIMLNRKAR